MDGGMSASFLLGALALLLVSAGIEDARTREIANWKNAAIALLAPLWWWANGLRALARHGDPARRRRSLVLRAVRRRVRASAMGGGDVKLIAALALWLPLQPLVWMLIVMSLLGGVLTLLMLDRSHALPRRTGADSRFPTASRSRSPRCSRFANRFLTSFRECLTPDQPAGDLKGLTRHG